MLGEELLGKGGTHAHSALHGGGREVSLSHLSPGGGFVLIGFHCNKKHNK